MNVQTRNIAFLGVFAVLAFGLVAVTGILPSTFALVGTTDQVKDNASLMGHIVLTVYDRDGNIKEYLQTDNSIVTDGENCAGQMLFGSTVTGCGITSNNVFNDIVIGTGTSALTDTIVSLEAELESIAGTATEDTASAGVGGDHIAKVTASTILSQVSAITESGLEEATSSELFARQQFSALNLNTGDTLTVDWLITIAG